MADIGKIGEIGPKVLHVQKALDTKLVGISKIPEITFLGHQISIECRSNN